MLTAAMATYTYGQIDHARTELKQLNSNPVERRAYAVAASEQPS